MPLTVVFYFSGVMLTHSMVMAMVKGLLVPVKGAAVKKVQFVDRNVMLGKCRSELALTAINVTWVIVYSFEWRNSIPKDKTHPVPKVIKESTVILKTLKQTWYACRLLLMTYRRRVLGQLYPLMTKLGPIYTGIYHGTYCIFPMNWYQWSRLGAVSIRKTVLPGMAIPMLKIRRPNGRLIFNMEIAIRR